MFLARHHNLRCVDPPLLHPLRILTLPLRVLSSREWITPTQAIPIVDMKGKGYQLHSEFISELGDLAPVQIEASGYVELRWQF